MKWEAGSGEEEHAEGEQVEEGVWEASSSNMSVITSSKFQYV